MDKALGMLSLARKAGKLELGEEAVIAAARARHAWLILLASDASDHTRRRADAAVTGTDQQIIRIPYGKEALGEAVGRNGLAIVSLTDPEMALAFLNASGQDAEKARESLEKRAGRIRRHRQEEKAHLRNRKTGRKSK